MMVCPSCKASYHEGESFCARDGSRLVSADELDRRVGTQIGSYRLLTVIGQGGMGVVYRGEHIYIGKTVAVKVLHQRFARNQEAVERFAREARASTKIDHPNIVDVTDFGRTEDGSVYFVMEHLDGQPLDHLVGYEAPLPLLRTLTILNQATLALSAAHRLGIIHRDLKPENIFLEQRAGRRELVRTLLEDGMERQVIEREQQFDFVKILDFGVAKILMTNDPKLLASQTVAGTIFGTPEYMAPEAARGEKIGPSVDIYALGIIFFEMATGMLPFESEGAVELLGMQIATPPPRPREVCPEAELTDKAEALILRMLEKDPRARPQSMDEVRDELRACYGAVRYLRDVRRSSQDPEPMAPTPRMPEAARSASGAQALGAQAPGAQAPGLQDRLTRPSQPRRGPKRLTEEIREELLGQLPDSDEPELEVVPADPNDTGPITSPTRKRLTDELQELFRSAPEAPDPNAATQPEAARMRVPTPSPNQARPFAAAARAARTRDRSRVTGRGTPASPPADAPTRRSGSKRRETVARTASVPLPTDAAEAAPDASSEGGGTNPRLRASSPGVRASKPRGGPTPHGGVQIRTRRRDDEDSDR